MKYKWFTETIIRWLLFSLLYHSGYMTQHIIRLFISKELVEFNSENFY